MSDLTSSDVRRVCRKTIAVFKKHDLPCCLVGSAATTLWGVHRIPNDIDIVVMTVRHTQERLKQLLASEDSDFYLKSSTNPRNTYKIVWCKVPGTYRECKVDVLVPGIMNIPSISASRFVWFKDNTLPSMPLLPLLLLKLQAWDDHRMATSRRPDLRAKQYVDVSDIDLLLIIAKNKGIHHRDGNALPGHFMMAAKQRVDSYILSYPTAKTAWQALGFNQEAHRTTRSFLTYNSMSARSAYDSLDSQWDF